MLKKEKKKRTSPMQKYPKYRGVATPGIGYRTISRAKSGAREMGLRDSAYEIQFLSLSLSRPRRVDIIPRGIKRRRRPETQFRPDRFWRKLDRARWSDRTRERANSFRKFPVGYSQETSFHSIRSAALSRFSPRPRVTRAGREKIGRDKGVFARGTFRGLFLSAADRSTRERKRPRLASSPPICRENRQSCRSRSPSAPSWTGMKTGMSFPETKATRKKKKENPSSRLLFPSQSSTSILPSRISVS